jgi:glycosyltransferase involved in cell wall biosynthesis
VVISHGLEREFGDRAENLEVIYNGYDKEDLYDGPLKPLDAFRLSYVGNFKPNQHVPAIWEVLAEQAKSDPEFGTNLRIRFTGIVDPTVIGYLESLGLKDAVEIEDFVPHLEATRRMVEAGMLLFVIPQSENNRVIITGKIFEYLASNTVLLPVGPLDGDAARILSEADLPPMLDYSDREGMRTRIREAYAAWKTGGRMPVKRTEGDYTRFSRRELTRRLAGLLDRMVERRSAASTQASTKASSKASTKPSTR